MGDGRPDELRYTAFLSYSHKDSAAAGRLHRRLETYRMPRRLVGTETPRGPVPARLAPIFRDREELPAATDLSATVRAALVQSGALIILCSPAAAGSLWVAEEIETFRRIHPDRPILAAVLDGDPPDCFPQVLRALGRDGTWHEPLATDLRKHRDGPRLGLLKLVAGITGVGLDALVQRDAARRIRRVMAVTGAALVAMLAMAALALVAINARGEAERQRAEAERQRAAAEGQIEFMLTDLRARLETVGRLDIMQVVNQHALRYYGGQSELGGLPAESLERRARILHLVGVDYNGAENYPAALTAFREAHRATAEQLDRDPANPDRIFAHSQSEFYVGQAAYDRRDYRAALRAFENYKNLAERLIGIDRTNATWIKELAFADGSICTVQREGLRALGAALDSCAASLARMEQAARASGDQAGYRTDIGNRHAELADTLWRAGRRQEALQHRYRQLALIQADLDASPSDASRRAKRIRALRGVANLEANLGQTARAAQRMEEAWRGMAALAAQDPARRALRTERDRIRAELIEIRTGRRH
ncbi:MAG TPA: toll/interleukin-1 receptor domain-containing protein [Allosphingosinicella sp.]|jgi:tetratricopeptide (TPR) repeat protein|nr:toll/interleukin-1 receptor domain-containing protein [Allosphingosinicella sp.]